jgi:hypothetical protein
MISETYVVLNKIISYINIQNKHNYEVQRGTVQVDGGGHHGMIRTGISKFPKVLSYYQTFIII